MLKYKDYEREIFDWLIEKNKSSGFTFGLRRVATKGAETDYFIGKEASNYFGTTFWNIPVSFPGSSGDLIQLIFQYTSNKREFVYFFECNQTKQPNNPQNQYALELIQSLKDPIEKKFGLKRPFNPNAKMYNFQVKPIEPSYGILSFMINDIESQMYDFIALVNEHIGILKNKYPDFQADQISNVDFNINLDKTYKRIEKHLNVNQPIKSGDGDLLNPIVSRELNDIVHLNLEQSKYYFSVLDKIIDKVDLKQDDQRVYYNYRKGRLIFGVGQRYVWCINNKKNYLRYISKKPNEVSSEKFEGGKEAYLNYSQDFSRKDISDLTILPIEETLAVTSLSGFLRYNKLDFEKMVFDKNFRESVFDGKIEFKEQQNNNEANMSNSPNQILYGPPGTGKTYNTINKAVTIANPFFDLSQDRTIIKAEYHRLVESGQIVFTTFHQSMSYEDFVEGIKPLVEEDEDGNKQVVYEVKNGIFKEIVNRSREIKLIDDKDYTYAFDDAWNELVELTNNSIEKGEKMFLPIQTKNLGLNVIGISAKGNLILKPAYSHNSKEYIVSYSRAKRLQEVYSDLSVVKNIDKEFRAIIGGSNSTAYWSVLNFINTKIEDNNNFDQHIVEDNKNYVLIIDEINRGNVSAIFGELITLIEESKRAGAEEALEVILPYSKEKFSVPSNLYIIGTMNTADRSVEALDTALRRRFVFEEMLPNPDLEELDYEMYGYKASAILKRINLRIEKLIDRDHCIGHAYFIGKNEETIIDSFYKNIIPLLQEYFFGDYGKIGLVLGSGFVQRIDASDDIFAPFDYDYRDDLASRMIYQIIDYRKYEDDEEAFKTALDLLMN
ncbi:McrB family protein [Sphingobacterium composti Ten et al. 2007 non Yoo et al. 2007]|uniref:McrB family protein n=1 Tax=Sphingobacterium composti TaxID=363260 RepID=UPI001357D8EB|nr:AAA family ATPase [Sphingobacterium composti Ten et al. 2007 non Yoo et al. 2007]